MAIADGTSAVPGRQLLYGYTVQKEAQCSVQLLEFGDCFIEGTF